MKNNRLGRSGITVSDMCMGTMTFGNQADEKTAFAIMDRAFDAGIDFYDTAEMYPVPPDAKYVGATEEIWRVLLKARSEAGILLVTSDLNEALSLSDRITVLFGGRIMETFGIDDAEKVERIGLLMAGIASETETSR